MVASLCNFYGKIWIGFCFNIQKRFFLRWAYTMKFFFHRWLSFSFDSFLSTFNTYIQLRNVNEIFQSTIMKVFQKKKTFTRFLIKIFSSEIHFMNKRSNLYWKWSKWLMRGEHERRNEWKFKNIRTTRKQKNQNNKTD